MFSPKDPLNLLEGKKLIEQKITNKNNFIHTTMRMLKY